MNAVTTPGGAPGSDAFLHDPSLALVERIRVQAEAALLAFCLGLLASHQVRTPGHGAVVFSAAQVVREDCAQRGTTVAGRLAQYYTPRSAALLEDLALVRRTVAGAHHELMLRRALTVLASPDSVCVRPGDLELCEQPEVLVGGAWVAVIDAEPTADGGHRLIAAGGERMPVARAERVWVRPATAADQAEPTEGGTAR